MSLLEILLNMFVIICVLYLQFEIKKLIFEYFI